MEIGDVYGNLTVVSDPYKIESEKYAYFVDCACSCGSGVKRYRKVALTKSNRPTRSCGCLQKLSTQNNIIPLKVGEVFGRLTIEADDRFENGRRFVKTLCSCGNSYIGRYDLIKSGHTTSCGCAYENTRLTNLKHGMTKTPTYSSWQAMKERCRNPKSPGFENYGGRGITYDPRWEQFENFFADMGERPELHDLDRIDVNGNYCKENCRWSDRTIQTFNKRKSEGKTSKYFGVCYHKGKELWQARLYYYKELVLNSYFMLEEEAAKAYDEACFKYYGVRKNFPEAEEICEGNVHNKEK